VLACTQATGVNSALNFSVKIFQESGLQGAFANWADLGFKIVNVVMTVIAVALVDKKGRTFLLKLGTSGIIVGLCTVATTFLALHQKWIEPGMGSGMAVLCGFVVFIAFYAVGPGVCVWLALSELMPNRIRANGMSIALLINQGVSTTIASTFLPWADKFGYESVFFTLAGFTVIYFITAAFFMPETKGKTLEEIEAFFK
ncbi:MAG: MFS transporter, partial [Kiritimatiellae bacterium]|nr:MFS transporter [Kiritimatiellia bacterium]